MEILDALARFLRQLAADGRSSHTIAQYRRHVLRFAAWWRDVGPRGAGIEQVGHEHVAAFLASSWATTRPDGQAKRGTSVNCLRSSVRGFLGYVHRAGYTRDDPGRLVRRARCGASPPRGLGDEERERLFQVLDAANDPAGKRDRVLFRLMLSTGVRLGSAVALDVEDVDLVAGELVVRSAKGSRPARIFLGTEARALLAEHLGDRTSGPLFPGRAGGRLTRRHVERRLAAWAERAGIRRGVSPHALRHTFAQGLYRKTGDVLLVQVALCHRSLSSTMVYARAEDDRLRRALA